MKSSGSAPLIKLIRAADYRQMPWKNGTGQTAEIAVADCHDGLLWRISLAQIKGAGPFSQFPDIKRTIIQLSGPPLTLQHKPGGSHTLEQLEPYVFDGSWDTEAHVSGPSSDFNVMVRRGKAEADVTTRSLVAGENFQLVGEAKHTFIHAAAGKVSIRLEGGNSRILPIGDTLRLENFASKHHSLVFKAEDEGAKLIVVAIQT